MKKMANVIFLVLFFGALSCSHKRQQFNGKNESERLAHFFKWSFDQILDRSPMDLAYIGIPSKQDQLNDMSYSYQEKTNQLIKEHLDILRSFSRDELTEQDQISYDLYEYIALQNLEDWQWYDYRYQVNQMFGIQSELPSFMINIHTVKNEKDLQNYISRLNQFEGVLGETVTQLMRSESKGIVPPKFVFEKVILISKNILKGKPFDQSKENSPLWADFLGKVKGLKLSKDKEKMYEEKAKRALQSSVGRGYKLLIGFLVEQEKRATNDDGVWKFPKGDQYYQSLLKKMMTQPYTPDQVHEIGLANVARIHNEMNQIKDKVGFKGSLQSFFKHMKNDKYFYKNNKQGKKAYLALANRYINEMRYKLDEIFLTKPKANIVVKQVESFREKSAGTAFYQNPSMDGSRPGRYYVNLYNMRGVPIWEAEALAYHEGIPGHHMQLSIAQELNGIPEFRKHLEITSYVEGWGLYSEKLPKEFGFYKDPYSDFGRLSMELMRACRLVVDSGIHSKKWSREKAVKYLDDNIPGDHAESLTEINRYIVMPGQATAYMIGMLKILELKEKSKKELGVKFDLRKFHDIILTNGAMPSKTMETLVNNYIKTTKTN